LTAGSIDVEAAGTQGEDRACQPLELHLPLTRASIEAARQAVLAHLAPATLPAPVTYNLELILEEVLMNLVMHAHEDPTGHEVHLAVHQRDDEVDLRFEDDGRPFDPTASEPSPTAGTLEDARIGGLGLPLLRRRARRLHYKRCGGRNVFTVTVGLVPREAKP
jgi:serine/threonine-protein kinase RsbW